MGILSKIFGLEPRKEATIDDYMKSHSIPVKFSKLYYKLPEKRVPFEGQTREYTSFEDMVKDFPEFIYHKFTNEIQSSRVLKVVSGYFYHFRGNFYNKPSIKECLSELIGKYKTDNWYSDPKDKCLLLEKQYIDSKFDGVNCFPIELGDDMKIQVLRLNGRGVVSAKVNSSSNSFTTVSIGSVHNKPITFGDKVLLINVEEHFPNKYENQEWYERDVPNFFQIIYGSAIILNNSQPFVHTEELLKKAEVEFDFLKYHDIDFNDYLEKLKKNSRKRKLQRLREIAKNS